MDARRCEIPAELAPTGIVALGRAHEASNLNANMTDGLAPCKHDVVASPILATRLYWITSFLLDYRPPFRQGEWGRALLPIIDQSNGLAFE